MGQLQCCTERSKSEEFYTDQNSRVESNVQLLLQSMHGDTILTLSVHPLTKMWEVRQAANKKLEEKHVKTLLLGETVLKDTQDVGDVALVTGTTLFVIFGEKPGIPSDGFRFRYGDRIIDMRPCDYETFKKTHKERLAWKKITNDVCNMLQRRTISKKDREIQRQDASSIVSYLEGSTWKNILDTAPEDRDRILAFCHDAGECAYYDFEEAEGCDGIFGLVLFRHGRCFFIADFCVATYEQGMVDDPRIRAIRQRGW
eukprot:gnl/MRDRNA2_/MRDRNA2_32809_c0_seq1.p1 gnl/MRDRNA2_/MRDRNA2_32809_c0~~gnl/MRDRNA2_/MRDRNA2_32809_c0_seq1.p1  ORF type:complete len:257 (-),score=26.95 gnl/MRDRNA2_/MRDRNA2_32809_c0_seq1:3-773(-)